MRGKMKKLMKSLSIKGIIIILLSIISAFIGIYCCITHIRQDTISSIAYSSLKSKDDYRVYIKEDGKYAPFLVIDNGYEEGSTLLLREEILAETKRMNEYSSYYKDSEIDRYFNGSYYENLKEIHSLIESTAVEIVKDEAIGSTGDGTEKINRNVFLLSAYELGFDMEKEGKRLGYFSNPDNRICYLSGESVSWLLRTPNTWERSVVCCLTYDGALGSWNAYGQCGIRPAFCVDSLAKIKEKAGIVEGKEVYVLE